MYQKLKILIVIFLMAQSSFSQLGMPVHSDYLSDNYYLLHPSMAGIANCDKIRLTARQRRFAQPDAPALQTVSYNGRVGEQSGLGIILFNDKDGYHSQKGAKLTYAHHLMFSRDEIDLNQLSFGMSANFLRSVRDETSFLQSGDVAPVVNGINVQNAFYYNIDIGASYNFLDFYVNGTIQNILPTGGKIYAGFEGANLRRYIFNAGYVYGDKEKILWEPSLMIQQVHITGEITADANLKAYKSFDFGRLWGALSYRRSTQIPIQYITPIIGVNVNKFMFAYTYSNLRGDLGFDTGGFHQITVGIDLFCKREKYECACPVIN